MLKKELIERSPIRELEKSIHGGLGKGNLGVFTARKGVGKTACLVHVATDKLLKGEKVLHISFADDPQHIENWYKQVYNEVSNAYKLENSHEIYDEILPLRLLLHFKQDDITFEDIKKNIKQFTSNLSFKPNFIIVDGFVFDGADDLNLKNWKKFAEENDAEVWFSATLHRHKLDFDEKGIPAPINKYADYFTVVIMLNPQKDYIHFKLLKDNGADHLSKLRLKLDVRTLLISNRRV
jgi:hypothetical protein